MNLGRLAVDRQTGSQASADLTQIETALTSLKDDASSFYAVEEIQVKADLRVISRETHALSSHPSATTIMLITTAAGDLRTAVDALLKGMHVDCPSS